MAGCHAISLSRLHHGSPPSLTPSSVDFLSASNSYPSSCYHLLLKPGLGIQKPVSRESCFCFGSLHPFSAQEPVVIYKHKSIITVCCLKLSNSFILRSNPAPYQGLQGTCLWAVSLLPHFHSLFLRCPPYFLLSLRDAQLLLITGCSHCVSSSLESVR